MKFPLLFSFFLFACFTFANAQSVSINATGSAPDNSAILDLKSSSKGLLLPRMLLSERNLIPSPAPGLLIWQTDNIPGLYYNAGSAAVPSWLQLGATGSQGPQGNPGVSNVPEYFHAYRQTAVLINMNEAIDFSTIAASTAAFSYSNRVTTVNSTGVYKIEYLVIAASDNQFFLNRNNAEVAGSRGYGTDYRYPNRVSIILSLTAGDRLSVQNGGNAAMLPFISQVPTPINASFTITKL